MPPVKKKINHTSQKSKGYIRTSDTAGFSEVWGNFPPKGVWKNPDKNMFEHQTLNVLSVSVCRPIQSA